MKKFLAIALSLALAVSASAATNHMPAADSITTSTAYNDQYSGEQTRDGIVMGNDFGLWQWVSDYEYEADLNLTWAAPVTVNKAIFYDRTSASDNVISGTITFSDGTVVEFGELEVNGQPTEIDLGKEITTTIANIHVVADDTTLCVGLDEVEFYTADGVNVALTATATASSELPDFSNNEWRNGDWYPAHYENWYVAAKAINGYVKALYPAGAEYEWASQGEPNPVIEITWPEEITVGTVVLYDRINTSDNIIGGTLTFSDGTSIELPELDPYGEALYLDVADVKTTSMKIETVSAGPNPGFAEIEVFTEHFVDGKPIEAVVEAPVVEEVVEEPVVEEPVETPEVEEVVETPVVEAPQTFDAGIIAAVAAVVSLAGYAISKKRG